MTLSEKHILVTGAGGFIGSHLCQALVERGAKVTALIRYNSRGSWGNLDLLENKIKNHISVTLGNIEDPGQMFRLIRGKDCVFHLAALIGIPYSYEAPHSYVKTNIEGTLNILEACKEAGTSRLIHTSTSETYGTALYSPMDEKHPLQAQSPYAASKVGADKLAMSYHLSFNLPLSIVRPFNTYGPRQSAQAVIPTIVSQALTQPNVTLGETSPIRDLTFVTDTAEAFLKVAENDSTIGQTLNVGSGVGVSVADLCKQILNIMGIDKPVISNSDRVRPQQSEVWKLIASAQQLTTSTGWTPQTSLEEGLRATIDFVNRHIDFFRSTRYQV